SAGGVDQRWAFPMWRIDLGDQRCGEIGQVRRQIDQQVVDEHAHVACRNHRPLDLTATEFALLVALVRDAGLVLSKRQLLRSVWGFDGYDGNVVEVHISALRRKLEQHGPRLIHTVRSLGYVVRHPAPSLFDGHSAADGRRRLHTTEPAIAAAATPRYQP
ncbi:MAG: winged helix-turn-helix domain-containing protein, partial [Ilumatobacteraceae bacterium]